MPEAPEVQTVLSTLEKQITNEKVLDVEILYSKLVEDGDIHNLIDQSFCEFKRLGKYLIFRMEDYDFIVHLRMEGKFYLYSKKEYNKHIHAIFTLSNGKYLCYHDTRKFGRMYVYSKKDDYHLYPCFKNVGIDFLEANPNNFYHCVHHKKCTVKQALLDQSIMAGVGNIYADEICFSCKLDPRTRCTRLSKKDCENIVYHTKRILNGAIRFGGTTIRSYTSSLGVTGRFQLQLKVHDQKVCKECGSDIKKINVAQRGTYLCPKCQKRK